MPKTTTKTYDVLDALDFQVRREPLYRRGEKAVNVDALVREDTDEVISVVSKSYDLVQNRDSILPLAKEVIGQGWQLFKADRVTRRKPVVVESGGRRAFIELWNPEIKAAATIQGKREEMSPRLTLFNSYDATKRLGIMAGDIQLICSNGLIRAVGPTYKMAFTHSGGQTKGFDKTGVMVREFLSNYDKTVQEWEVLGQRRPGAKTLTEVINEALGERKAKTIIEDLGPEATAWQAFDKITNSLTFNNRISESILVQKQRKAVKTLLS